VGGDWHSTVMQNSSRLPGPRVLAQTWQRRRINFGLIVVLANYTLPKAYSTCSGSKRQQWAERKETRMNK